MVKVLTVPKCADNLAKNTPQMTKNLSAQFVCPSSKVLNFNEKRPQLGCQMIRSMFRELGMYNFVPSLLPSPASVHSNRPVYLKWQR